MTLGEFQGVKVNRYAPMNSHLFFVDDNLIFSEATARITSYVKRIIGLYGNCLGQIINFDKSGLFFSTNVNETNKKDVRRILEVSNSYLRDKINSSVRGWSVQVLSQGGKEVFIRSILQHLECKRFIAKRATRKVGSGTSISVGMISSFRIGFLTGRGLFVSTGNAGKFIFAGYFLVHKQLYHEIKKGFPVSLSLLLINLAAVMERADENLLPFVYKEVSEAFNVGPSDLGYLTFIRNFVQGLASPLAGVLVINYNRPTVLAVSTLCWALSTAEVGGSQRFLQVALWRAVNGFGLTIVIPALQSFIADSYLDGVRGDGFELLSLIGSLGGIGGGVIATIMAGQLFWVDTNRDVGYNPDRLLSCKGFVGSLPWTAMVFFTMWFELIGFDHSSTAALLSLFAIGFAMGSFLGGLMADRMSQIYPHSARIMCAQFSAFMGIPFSCWNATAANGPMFAEVIPAEHPTMIYAFDRAFEGSISSLLLPWSVFYRRGCSVMIQSIDPIKGSSREALALSRGLLSMMAIPFGLCCLLYTPLYNIFGETVAMLEWPL
ncbi:BES1/BZR1-like protein 2-like [Hibiscus syriacus]|uniref:BES1/BZR1-like protein 2-like n=1 Tax=Hibiscus syriacus TaxID=106335 RepID=A0A6A3AQW4_HIBSY|nr:BES1/BZR1-like protein 2-like [Hibiscus syriacus]